MGSLTLTRHRRSLGAGILLVAVLGVVVVVLRSGGQQDDDTSGVRTVQIESLAAPTEGATGWNLRGGGTLSDGEVVAPRSAPDGAAVPGQGQAATDAGPGDFVGFQPRTLVLPSGASAPISSAGVRGDGTLAVPDDPAKIGWWTGGALPGERYGGVVLAGHVDSKRYGVGVLAEMLRVRPGAVISVAGPAQEKLSYKVIKVSKVDKARLAADTGAFDQTVTGRLVLITCGGPYNPQTHHYRDNIVVVAEPVR